MEEIVVTSPILDLTEKLHLGYAYPLVLADVITRWNILKGEKCTSTWGICEQGRKARVLAEKEKSLFSCSKISTSMQKTLGCLNLIHNSCIETANISHINFVTEAINYLAQKGDVYRGNYNGCFCEQCDAYILDTDIIEGNRCPIHKTPLREQNEPCYFLRLSKYQDAIQDYIKGSPHLFMNQGTQDFVSQKLKEGLLDICITRKNRPNEMPFPLDGKLSLYSWINSLLAYRSGLPSGDQSKQIQIFGKNIVWFHAVVEIALSLGLGISLPQKLIPLGWLSYNKKNMSISGNNYILIEDAQKLAGPDALRYFLLRDIRLGQDKDFTEARLKELYNSELANKYGNLVSRSFTLAAKYGCRKIDYTSQLFEPTIREARDYADNCDFFHYIETLGQIINGCNARLEEKKPWKTKDIQTISSFIGEIKDITILLWPIIPNAAEKVLRELETKPNIQEMGAPIQNENLRKIPPLFPKIS